MAIKEIRFVDLYDFKNDYLVWQGCGGPLEEWIDGIQKLLIDEGCAKKNYKIKEAYHFMFNDISNIMISLDDLDIPKLAMIRLRLRDTFGTMWLSDYINNI